MARQTKQQLIDEFKTVVDEYSKLTPILFKLWDEEEKITYGEFYLNNCDDNYAVKTMYGYNRGSTSLLYGKGKERTTLIVYNVYLQVVKQGMAEAKKLIEERAGSIS